MLVVKQKVITDLPLVEVESDMIIFEEGEHDHTMYFIVDGHVKLYSDKDGAEKEIAMLRKYQFFGDNEMYSQKPRTVSAKTIEPAKLVIIKSEAEFERFVTQNRWLSGQMMETMSEKLVQANNALASKRASGIQPTVNLEVAEKEDPNGKGGGARRIVRH